MRGEKAMDSIAYIILIIATVPLLFLLRNSVVACWHELLSCSDAGQNRALAGELGFN